MVQISLKAARVNAELKQCEAAAKIGVSTATIIRWEAGKTAPDSDKLQKLCEVYGVPIDSIFLNKKYA